MAQSVQARIKRGKLRMIFNKTFQTFDFYRRTARGKYLLCNPWANRDLAKGPGYAEKQLDKWAKA